MNVRITRSMKFRAVASHLLVGVLTTLLGVLDDYTVSVNVRSCMRSVLH